MPERITLSRRLNGFIGVQSPKVVVIGKPAERDLSTRPAAISNSHFRLEDGEFGRFPSAACDSGDQKENFNGPKAIAGNGHRPRNSEGQRPVPFQPGAMAPGTGSIDMLEG